LKLTLVKILAVLLQKKKQQYRQNRVVLIVFPEAYTSGYKNFTLPGFFEFMKFHD